jgi:hypothetical protein
VNLSSASLVLKAVYLDKPGTAAPYNHGNSTANRYLFNFKSGTYVYNIDADDGSKVCTSGAHTLYFTVNGGPTIYAAPFTMK